MIGVYLQVNVKVNIPKILNLKLFKKIEPPYILPRDNAIPDQYSNYNVHLECARISMFFNIYHYTNLTFVCP